MTELMQELIEFIKNTSPLVWAALVRQVYVAAWTSLAWAAILTIFSALSFGLGRYSQKRLDEWEYIMILSYAFSIIAFPVALWLATTAFMRFANPEYYALKTIVVLLSQCTD